MTEPHPADGHSAAAPAAETAAPGQHLLELARTGEWRTLVDLGRFGLALQTLRLQGGGDPDVMDALAGLADVEASVRTKSLAAARKRFDRIDARPPDLVDWAGIDADLGTLAVAVPAVDRRDMPEARAALTQLRTEAFAAERDALIGTMAVVEGDADAGLVAFETALERDPSHVRAWTNRGNVKLEAGDVDGAIADYERALKLDDGFANAHHNLGVAYRRKGQVGKSVASLRRAQRQSSRRDAEEARATVAGGRAALGSRRWLRWLGFAVIAGIVLWWLRQSGTI